MKVEWEQGFDQRVVVDKLGEHVAKGLKSLWLNPNGSDLVAIVRSMVKFSEELPWETRYELVRSGLAGAIAAKATAPKDVLLHIQRAAKAYASKPSLTFTMYTSISVLPTNNITKSKVCGATLTFPKRMPAKVQRSRADIFRDHGHYLNVLAEPKMKTVRVEVQARTTAEASKKALDAIDFLRGVWNFRLTSAWRQTLSGPRKPINAVFLGPVHSFHREDGEVLENQFWYDGAFNRAAHLTDYEANNGQLGKAAKEIVQLVSRHLYGAVLERVFVRYARALDIEDHDHSILLLWSLLEFLTDTGFSSYDKTVRRARFVYAEADYAGLTLEHLRKYRNRSIHGGNAEGSVENEVYQLKRCVDSLIRFHLGNRFKFESLAAACNLLDLPPEEEQLKARLQEAQLDVRLAKAAALFRKHSS